MKKIFFMAGFPRSGATLLSSILEQNPDVHCPPSSPLINLMVNIHNSYNVPQNIEYDRSNQIGNVLNNISTHFYGDKNERIIIDKNWAWVQELPSDIIFRHITKDIRFLCPVRDPREVVNSFLRILNNTAEKYNLMDKSVEKAYGTINNDNRAKFVIDTILKENYKVLKKRSQAEEFRNSFLLIPYDQMLNNMQKVLTEVYDFLDIDTYDHKLVDIVNPYVNDTPFMREMHEVRSDISERVDNGGDYLLDLSEDVLSTIREYDAFWVNNDRVNIVK